MRLPRVVIAAAASGQGKTTVAVGVMAALTRAGHVVAGAKVGPDFIDPGYHELATGRPGRNLDPWLQGESRILPLLAHGAATPDPADLTVVEGVMGLFDGRLGTDGWASTAHVATLTRSPVVVVIDISSASRTVAATVHGLRTFDPDVRVAGVILNKAGSTRHADEVRRSVEQLGVPVLGVLPRDAGVSAPSRHLGLVPAAERPEAAAALDRLAEQTAELIDLDAIVEIASAAPDLDTLPWSPVTLPDRARMPSRRVAVAGGRAFTFRYAETEEQLRALGLEPVVFDPALDTALPAGTAGIYLGGGFPEVHAGALSTNRRLLADVRDAVLSGVPTVAECAGLLYLCEAVDGHGLVGAVPARAAMHPRLTLRYVTATAPEDTLLAPAGAEVRGHEFHRTRTTPGHGERAAWRLHGSAADGSPEGWSLDPAGTGSPTVHASYLHTHWAGHPELGLRFAEAVHASPHERSVDPGAPGVRSVVDARSTNESGTGGNAPAATNHPGSGNAHDPGEDLLEHHGDLETDPHLVDLAVNVRLAAPPPWLANRLREHIGDLAAYPDVRGATRALARRHGVGEDTVLPTSGAAEAFVLLARMTDARRPVVVHPQFTEPEAALRRAGVVPERVVLDAADGFRLEPGRVPDDADLVVIGNPTNPTGVLHPRSVLESLRRPGRLLVVDEAFMDTITGERDSLISPDMDGVLVLRSLTKTWGLAGLRAGYAVGSPAVVGALARQQPHWSVSSLAASVMEATSTPAAVAEAEAATRETDLWRNHLVAGLRALGLSPIASQTSFVLVTVGAGVRERMRERGYALRRGDTFPGLGPEWVRIAVRDPQTIDGMLRELATVLTTQERIA
ncbi:cobyrinic acid a,c-diamide synthase [Knoellia remsis]|uniref:Hydrogenobyrinate a,c-diamide synthase n=1 Tax=Knoellia remsis TaxID=407159 RepID=A0A2T0UZL6_9MICO|nr:cobyrinate a,c-diamide synthase [Knoellia remsis]PRY63375.1 cobyrinic acid a,c-diamide synthase [Knoellia remsis]